MKFFFKLVNVNLQKKSLKKQNKNTTLFKNFFEIQDFLKFLIKNGESIKKKNEMSIIIENFNYFLCSKSKYISEFYPDINPIIQNIIQKKLSYISVFSMTISLIKPPFIIKAIKIPKRLRRKTKKRFLTKIVYKNDTKKLKSAYKQLHYYSSKFSDSKFKVRCYKALMFSFLD